jgi:hypothetical protein
MLDRSRCRCLHLVVAHRAPLLPWSSSRAHGHNVVLSDLSVMGQTEHTTTSASPCCTHRTYPRPLLAIVSPDHRCHVRRRGGSAWPGGQGHLWPSRSCSKMHPGPWMLTATTPPSSSTTTLEIGLFRHPLLRPLRRSPRIGLSRHRLRLVERHRLGMRLGPLLSPRITTTVAGVHLVTGSGRSPASPARPI